MSLIELSPNLEKTIPEELRKFKLFYDNLEDDSEIKKYLDKENEA